MVTMCFEPVRPEKLNSQTQILCDGNGSHITADFICYCQEYKIVLFILPPHISHLMQPLDVDVFRPLKKAMSSKIPPLISFGVSHHKKLEWLSAFVQAHQEILTPGNIQGGSVVQVFFVSILEKFFVASLCRHRLRAEP